MDQQDKRGFYLGLNEMAAFFCDPLSEVRLRLYWEIMRDRCTLAEWQHAWTEAMAGETFHKVPLPAVLLEYISAYRQLQKEEQRRQQRMLAEEQRLAEPTNMPSDAWLAERDQAFVEARESLNTIFGANWRTVADMQLAMERSDRDQRIRGELRKKEREG